jgi:hypothetical protein
MKGTRKLLWNTKNWKGGWNTNLKR